MPHNGQQRNGDEKQQPVSQEPIILVTTIDICPGVSKSVELRRHDVPEHVARQFCDEHGLPDNILAPLTSHLQQHLEKAQLKVRTASCPSETNTARHRWPVWYAARGFGLLNRCGVICFWWLNCTVHGGTASRTMRMQSIHRSYGQGRTSWCRRDAGLQPTHRKQQQRGHRAPRALVQASMSLK